MTRRIPTLLSTWFSLIHLAFAVSAESQEATQPVTLRSYATIHSIGVEWDIQGDTNHNASVEVRFRRVGQPLWFSGMPLIRVYNSTSNMLAGSILFLQPGNR